MKNNVYKKIEEYKKKEDGVISSIKIQQQDFYKEYLDFMDYLISMDGQKVKIKYITQYDFIDGQGEKTGKIKVIDGQVRFYEGRKTARYFNLDAGIYKGWYATLIVLEVNILDNRKERK